MLVAVADELFFEKNAMNRIFLASWESKRLAPSTCTEPDKHVASNGLHFDFAYFHTHKTPALVENRHCIVRSWMVHKAQRLLLRCQSV